VVSRSFTLPHWTPAAIDEELGLFLYRMVPKGASVETRFV